MNNKFTIHVDFNKYDYIQFFKNKSPVLAGLVLDWSIAYFIKYTIII